MYTYSFERLEVWQLAKELAKNIYQITGEFPEEEKFGMVVQMRRSSISVPSNIAEGISRISHKEKKRFIEISYGSLMELLSQVIIASELHFIGLKDYTELRDKCNELSNKLNALSKSY